MNTRIFSSFDHPDEVQLRIPAVDQEEPTVEPVSRRAFITRTSAVAAAAGAAVTIPGVAAGASERGEREREMDLPHDAELDETVVAHLRDLRNGKVAVFAGDREIIVKDKRLAALLYKVTR
jgi:hypothetical protein